ncbi:MAG: hypothetical protein ACI4HN_00920 [Ruminococcus sp.]
MDLFWELFPIYFALICVCIVCICVEADKKKKKQKEEEIKNAKQKEKENRETFVNKIKAEIQSSSDNSYSSYDFSEADRKFSSIFSRIAINYLVRPLPETPKHRSAAIRGGIVDGLAGPAAGIYTAVKTEQQNLKDKERYQENLAERQKNIDENRIYYAEITEQFKIIVIITKKYMSKKVYFLNQLPSDYDEMYDLCCSYSNSSDKETQICAKGLISYLNELKLCKKSI